jgi:hypothetical protein
MNEQDDEVAHPGNGNNTSQTNVFKAICQFAIDRSLRTVVQEFVAHYHSERNHQGLRNRIISPEVGHIGNAGEVQRRERLGAC